MNVDPSENAIDRRSALQIIGAPALARARSDRGGCAGNISRFTFTSR